MARTVFCEYLKQVAEGLDFQLYPGELGKAEHRKLLEEEMVNFLFEGKDVHIEGYVPPSK